MFEVIFNTNTHILLAINGLTDTIYQGNPYHNAAADSGSDSYQTKQCVQKAPQGTDGYVYYQYYTGEKCSGSKSYAEGLSYIYNL